MWVADERTAQEALWKQEIYGYLVLPANLKRDVYAQRGAVAGVLGNGAYLLPSKEVQTGFKLKCWARYRPAFRSSIPGNPPPK